MADASPLSFHPFLADRFAEAVVPACAVLVVDHDVRPLERLLGHVAKADAKWLDAAALTALLSAADKAVASLPKGEPPEDLIASHALVYDPHTKREVVLRPPPWSKALNEVAAGFCVATRKVSGWNPGLLASTDDGETFDKFVAAAGDFGGGAFDWYSKLGAGMVAWMQGGPLRGWLSRAEVPLLRKALHADEAAMFRWKERGADFHRRKLQAFCFLAEKNGVGLAAVQAGP